MSESGLEYQASVERLSDIERKLAVEIPWEQVKARLDEAYRDLGRGVTVKGFRKGKVPRRMLEQMFGQHVNKEVAQRLVQDSITKVFVDEELAPVTEPEVDDEGLVDGAAFRYSALFQVVPEIEAKDYFGVDLKQRPARATDEDLESALAAKQRELTEYRPIEGRKTDKGDVLLLDLMGKIGDQPFDRENVLVELGEANEPLPGIAERLTGIDPEEQEIDVELDIPAGEGRTERARLLVTVKDAKQKVVPELDDDFAKDTGEAESLEELKSKLRQQVLERDEGTARDEARQRLMSEILKKNDVPVVPALVERHLDRIIKLQLALTGMNPDDPSIDQQELKERMREDAEETVCTALLLEAIAKKEQVEAHEADLEKRLAEIASERDQNVAKVRADFEKQGRLEQLKSSLREEKTLDLLMSKANIIIEEIPDSEEGQAPADGAREEAQSDSETSSPDDSPDNDDE